MPSSTNDYLGIYILEGSCSANHCLKYGWDSIDASVAEGEDYYIVVDGYNGAQGSWNIALTKECFATCTQDSILTCASGTVSGTLTGQADQVGFYGGNCNSWQEPGGEMIYTFVSEDSQSVSFTLSNVEKDADIFVLDGACDAGDCAVSGDSTASLNVVGGQTYYVVVDDYTGQGGTFDLTVGCE